MVTCPSATMTRMWYWQPASMTVFMACAERAATSLAAFQLLPVSGHRGVFHTCTDGTPCLVDGSSQGDGSTALPSLPSHRPPRRIRSPCLVDGRCKGCGSRQPHVRNQLPVAVRQRLQALGRGAAVKEVEHCGILRGGCGWGCGGGGLVLLS